MRSYIKGIITGIAISAVIAAIPVLAQQTDMLFNTVRININGIDRIQWDENLTLSDGTTAPTSILYHGTTYLPVRRVSELLEKDVYWNGDSNTVTITNSSSQTYVEPLVEKPDKNGNVWEYCVYSNDAFGTYYLRVRDKVRGYERLYRMISSSVRVTDDAIYFARVKSYGDTIYQRQADLIKLSFDNDENSQDGEIIGKFSCFILNELVFDGDYVFFAFAGGGTSPNNIIGAYNYITNSKMAGHGGGKITIRDLTVEESDETSVRLRYRVHNPSYGNRFEEVVFYKKTNDFGGAKEVD